VQGTWWPALILQFVRMLSSREEVVLSSECNFVFPGQLRDVYGTYLIASFEYVTLRTCVEVDIFAVLRWSECTAQLRYYRCSV